MELVLPIDGQSPSLSIVGRPVYIIYITGTGDVHNPKQRGRNMLVQQFDKIAIISKREMKFTTTNEKTGAQQEVHQRYVTGFDAVSGTSFSDLSVTDDSPIKFDEVKDNTIYDCVFVTSVVPGTKNTTRTAGVALHGIYGVIECKPVQKK